MITTSMTRSSNAARVSRRLGTARIEPGSYVAFRVDPHASLAVLGDPKTDCYTKDLLEPQHSKVYLALVLEANKLVECGRYQLTLSVVGPRPATLSQDDAEILVPIISTGFFSDSSIARPPVFPTLPLLWADAYHYPNTIRVKVATTVFPEDCSSFPFGFPRLGENDVKRLGKYAGHDAPRMKALEEASRDRCALQDLKPMDMAAEIAQVKTAIREAPWNAFDSETSSERRDRLRVLNRETDPTLPGGVLHWEPVVTIWMNPHEAGDSLTLPEMLDTEIALLKRVADMFNRRWVDWVRALYVLRSTNSTFLPRIYDRQGPKPSPTAVVLKESVPPSGLATRDVTTEHHLESSQGGDKPIAVEPPSPFKDKSSIKVPTPASDRQRLIAPTIGYAVSEMLEPPSTDSRRRQSSSAKAFASLQSDPITLQSSPSMQSATLSPYLSHALTPPHHDPFYASGRSPYAGASSKPIYGNAIKCQLQSQVKGSPRDYVSLVHRAATVQRVSCFAFQVGSPPPL